MMEQEKELMCTVCSEGKNITVRGTHEQICRVDFQQFGRSFRKSRRDSSRKGQENHTMKKLEEEEELMYRVSVEQGEGEQIYIFYVEGTNITVRGTYYQIGMVDFQQLVHLLGKSRRDSSRKCQENRMMKKLKDGDLMIAVSVEQGEGEQIYIFYLEGTNITVRGTYYPIGMVDCQQLVHLLGKSMQDSSNKCQENCMMKKVEEQMYTVSVEQEGEEELVYTICLEGTGITVRGTYEKICRVDFQQLGRSFQRSRHDSSCKCQENSMMKKAEEQMYTVFVEQEGEGELIYEICLEGKNITVKGTYEQICRVDFQQLSCLFQKSRRDSSRKCKENCLMEQVEDLMCKVSVEQGEQIYTIVLEDINVTLTGTYEQICRVDFQQLGRLFQNSRRNSSRKCKKNRMIEHEEEEIMCMVSVEQGDGELIYTICLDGRVTYIGTYEQLYRMNFQQIGRSFRRSRRDSSIKKDFHVTIV